MPAILVPHSAIPELAERVTPDMLKVLGQLQKADFILNNAHLDRTTVEILRRLTELGLVDPGDADDPRRAPTVWMANGNGSRVLTYRTGIRGGPHYELPSAELAAWLEQQGPDHWWTVDGDSLLTGRMTFPCLTQALAAELRTIGRPLLVQAKKDDAAARGQVIGKDKIDAVTDTFANNSHMINEGEEPSGSDDRILYLCWKGSIEEWLLSEDSETTALMITVAVDDRIKAEKM
jgi:hypothetical protein